MTRKLECKSASRLLKNAFAAKGAALTHTEALDILARLEGYEAWSHMKAAERKQPKEAAASKKKKTMSYEEVLLDRFGAWHSFPAFSRRDWQYLVSNGDTTRGYFEALMCEHLVDEYPELESAKFEVPQFSCTDARGQPVVWNLESDLTDRWGEVNLVQPETKPGLLGLLLDEPHLEKLRALMCDECTFIVCKDGKYGLLFELEYMSVESDGEHADPRFTKLKPHAQVVAALQRGLLALEKDFPDVEFCVPPVEAVVANRPGVWGFVSGEMASEKGQEWREELARRMSEL